MAYGAREGYPKEVSELEVLRMRRERGVAQPVPHLETIDELWHRVRDWLEELCRDVLGEHDLSPSSTTAPDDGTYHVAVFTHAGVIRQLMQRLVGSDKLRSYPSYKHDDKTGKTMVPNTSVTIIDIRPVLMSGKIRWVPDDDRPLENVRVVELNWAGHLAPV
jgi:broad specificity phosphatase PhoE